MDPRYFARGHWRPAVAIQGRDIRPPLSSLIVFGRKPWRLLDIRELHPANWSAEDQQAFEDSRGGHSSFSREEWERRPMVFVMEPAAGGKRESFIARPWQRSVDGWTLLPEHYAICASCGELAPCREYEGERFAEQEAARANVALERALSVLPGCCWGCGEPITDRQGFLAFEGDNVDLPGGPPVVFHSRQKCRGWVLEYDRRWAAATKKRRKFACDGKAIFHVDGFECTEEPLCPGEQARHISMSNHRRYIDSRCLRCKDARTRRAAE